MKIYLNTTSPFSRLVLITMLELDINNIELHWVDPWASPSELISLNPFCLVPTIVLDEGESLFESHIICEYLIENNPSGRISDGKKWKKFLAIGKLLLETSFKIVMLERFHSLINKELKERMITAITNSLDYLVNDSRWTEFKSSPITLAHLSIAVAINYINFRLSDEISLNVKLKNWINEVNKIPSFQETTVEKLTEKYQSYSS